MKQLQQIDKGFHSHPMWYSMVNWLFGFTYLNLRSIWQYQSATRDDTMFRIKY
jgi:hypothetical protein